MTGLSYGTVDEDVVDGRRWAGALDDGVVGGGASGEDAEVVVQGTRRGEGGCEGCAGGVRGVEVAREEAVVWLQVTPELLHAADLLHPLTVSDLRVQWTLRTSRRPTCQSGRRAAIQWSPSKASVALSGRRRRLFFHTITKPVPAPSAVPHRASYEGGMAARADPMSQSSCQQRTSGLRASTQRRARPVCKTMPPQLWVMNVSTVGWTRSASEGAGGGGGGMEGGGSRIWGSCGVQREDQGRTCTGTAPSKRNPWKVRVQRWARVRVQKGGCLRGCTQKKWGRH